MLPSEEDLQPTGCVTAAAFTCLGGLGVWLLVLAAIGFHYHRVPADTADDAGGKPEGVRFFDGSVSGIPVAQYYPWYALIGGLAVCAFVIWLGYQFRISRRGPPNDGRRHREP